MHKQSGFTVLETLLMIVVVGGLVAAGVTVYNNKDDKAKTSSSQSQDKKTNATEPEQTPVDKNQGYFVIKEWGIRVKTADLDPAKLTYTIVPVNATQYTPAHEVAKLYLTTSVTANEACRNLHTSYIKKPVVNNGEEVIKQVAVIDGFSYTWGNEGGTTPPPCGDPALDGLRLKYAGGPYGWQVSKAE